MNENISMALRHWGLLRRSSDNYLPYTPHSVVDLKSGDFPTNLTARYN
jgi:hypothetical protein